MKKRILSILLLGAMLISFAACGNDSNENQDTGNSDSVSDTTDVLPAGIAKKNYGRELNILYPDWGHYPKYFFADELDGEAMNVALFNRELKVEEYLGIEVNFQLANNNGDSRIYAIYPCLQQMALSGDDLYQIVLTHCIRDTAVMITDGLLLDLNTVNTINFDADWWNQTSNENLEVNGKQYYAISDFLIPDPNAIVFNKGMIEKLDLENPYELVREGKWTIDKMMEMMSKVTLDDGDGVWDTKDTYGFGAPHDWYLTSFTYACGEQLVTKSEDGGMVLALNTPRAYTVFEKIDALLNNPDTYVYDYEYGDPGKYDPTKIVDIATDRCLFNIVALNRLDSLRDCDVEFGILPYPKFNEEQDDYISLDWSGLMCVPLKAENHDMIGEAIELFSYYASEEVLPAFYDIVLGEKLSRDPESREMLGIIYDGIIFDAGMNYFGFHTNMTKFWNICNSIANGEMTGYSSYLEKYGDAAQAEIDSFIEAAAKSE